LPLEIALAVLQTFLEVALIESSVDPGLLAIAPFLIRVPCANVNCAFFGGKSAVSGSETIRKVSNVDVAISCRDDSALLRVFSIKEVPLIERAVSTHENTESLKFVSRLIPGAFEK
jgi:hypothetical protein